ncbi:hypothetical protein MKJ04_21245 [Pontibacter sp. E15-1]|uniref:hypothetical protein n=1 Tax=Pontibacter sp. E15-1 TaxID=2919918 RepID=UPI001F4F9252|nr:hypothetical protein [Pontibacter sp. E15-1]MCJ8167381.1 hypothetical protein [Pontibacter sp. E15-1]
MPFNEFFKRLLGHESGKATCTKLERTGKYKAAYKEWLNAQVYLNWTGVFYKSYHFLKANFPAPLRVEIVRDTHVRGVVFFYDPSIGATNFCYFFDLLRDRVLEQGYTLHNCDKLEIRHERYTEQIEKHLLTPPASDLPGTSLCNQLYGNVLLDYIKVNKHPGYIRFAANAYHDSYFSPALPFEELLEKVLQPDETPRP